MGKGEISDTEGRKYWNKNWTKKKTKHQRKLWKVNKNDLVIKIGYFNILKTKMEETRTKIIVGRENVEQDKKFLWDTADWRSICSQPSLRIWQMMKMINITFLNKMETATSCDFSLCHDSGIYIVPSHTGRKSLFYGAVIYYYY